MAAKNRDADIRMALVQRLLARGIERCSIRHEITLDSHSSDGRADLVVLRPGQIIGVEIKSASDKLDRLEKQRPRYSARFDRIVLICDERHKPWSTSDYYGWQGWECCTARSTDSGVIEFDENYWTGLGAFQHPADGWDRSGHLSARAMLEMLWADEVRGMRGSATATRTSCIPWLADNLPMKDIRAGVAAALGARQLNRWEERFWSAFDAAREAA